MPHTTTGPVAHVFESESERRCTELERELAEATNAHAAAIEALRERYARAKARSRALSTDCDALAAKLARLKQRAAPCAPGTPNASGTAPGASALAETRRELRAALKLAHPDKNASAGPVNRTTLSVHLTRALRLLGAASQSASPSPPC